MNRAFLILAFIFTVGLATSAQAVTKVQRTLSIKLIEYYEGNTTTTSSYQSRPLRKFTVTNRHILHKLGLSINRTFGKKAKIIVEDEFNASGQVISTRFLVRENGLPDLDITNKFTHGIPFAVLAFKLKQPSGTGTMTQKDRHNTTLTTSNDVHKYSYNLNGINTVKSKRLIAGTVNDVNQYYQLASMSGTYVGQDYDSYASGGVYQAIVTGTIKSVGARLSGISF